MARFEVKSSESVFLPYYNDNGKIVFVKDGADMKRISFSKEYEAQAWCRKHRCGYIQMFTKRFEYKLDKTNKNGKQ